MPYRRNRGSYYRRRPARGQTMWVRNNVQSGGQYADDTLFAVDLLAPLHTDDAILKVGGQYSEAPSGFSRTILRIRLQYICIWGTSIGPDALRNDDRMALGIAVAPWKVDTASTTVNIEAGTTHGYDPWNSANTTDWLFWHHYTPFDADHETYGSLAIAGGITDTIVASKYYDVRSRRRIKELGETPILFTRYIGAGAGPSVQNVTSSVLLSPDR